jgi:hypothetical protein
LFAEGEQTALDLEVQPLDGDPYAGNAVPEFDISSQIRQT